VGNSLKAQLEAAKKPSYLFREQQIGSSKAAIRNNRAQIGVISTQLNKHSFICSYRMALLAKKMVT